MQEPRVSGSLGQAVRRDSCPRLRWARRGARGQNDSAGSCRSFVPRQAQGPLHAIPFHRLELKPYFFTGAGATQNHVKELNAGAGTTVKLKLFENIRGSGVTVALEADGGVKFNWDQATGESQFKGFFGGGAVLEAKF